MATKKALEISGMTVDRHIQARETIVSQVVTEYAEAMQGGEKFPPVDVYSDGETYWLADGFHRVEAAKRCGFVTIDAVIHEGNRRDAMLHSVGSNANHGLRRSNEDKRKAVMTLLEDEEWSKESDNWIAKTCKVTHPFVGKLRAELSCNGYKIESERLVRRGNQTYTQDTTNIGQSKVSQQPIAFMSKDTTAPEGQDRERSSLPIRQSSTRQAPVSQSLDDSESELSDLIQGHYNEDGDWIQDSYSEAEKDALQVWIETSYHDIWPLKEKFFEGDVVALLTDKHFRMVKSLSVFLQDLILDYREANP